MRTTVPTGLTTKSTLVIRSVVAAILTSSLAITLTARVFSTYIVSWRLVVLGFVLSVAIAITMAYVAAKLWPAPLARVPGRMHFAFFLLAAMFGSIAIWALDSGGTDVPVSWVKAVGAFKGQHVPLVQREAWGNRHASIEMHATADDATQWLWRVSGDLPPRLQRLGGRLSFFVTQPEWAVLGPDGKPLASDGVQLRWFADEGGEQKPLSNLTLSLFANPDQRRWQQVYVSIPTGVARMTLEALPGPVGSTNWNDRVFINTARAESVLDILVRPLELFSVVLGLYAAGILIYAIIVRQRNTLPLVPLTQSFALGAQLWILLLVVRLVTFGIPWAECSGAAGCTESLLVSTQQDSLYVLMVTALVAAALLIVRKNQWLCRVVLGALVIVSLFSVCLSVLNLEIARMLGGPLNYQWLYYSEFLTGQTVRTSLLAYLTPASIVMAVFALTGFAAAAVLANRLAKSYGSLRLAAFASLTVVLGLGLALVPAGRKQRDDATELRSFNPVMSFIGSLFVSINSTQLFNMETTAGTTDFERIADNEMPPIPTPAPNTGIRNVIIFVLESVAAEYLLDEKAIGAAIPELTRHRRQAVSFPNIYAHAPASNKSLVSILASAYPLISYKGITQEKPDIALESLGTVFRARGYRTGFFSSGDTRFGRGDEFISHQGVDTVVSYKDMNCQREAFHNSDNDRPFQDGYDDRCMLEAFMKWDGVQRSSRFFAMLWPNQTHHPYSVIGQQVNFGVESEEFNRYLNALHQTDATFGDLMRWLDSRGLADDTLVVVIGDHGEAFGQHDQWIHASDIYDENVRVPLLLVNRRLYHGQTNNTVGGLVDIAPTVTEILGLTSPGSWQGRNLFSHQRSARTYFFSPYGKFVFGLREGDLKFIMNATANSKEVYDLATDPWERRNLADRMPEFVHTSEERLASWVQYQVALYERLLR